MFFQNSNIHSTRLQPFSLHVYDGIVRLVNKKARVYLNFKRQKPDETAKNMLFLLDGENYVPLGFLGVCIYIYYYIYISSVTSIPYDFWDIPMGYPTGVVSPDHETVMSEACLRYHAENMRWRWKALDGSDGWMDGRTDGWMDIHRNMLCNDD